MDGKNRSMETNVNGRERPIPIFRIVFTLDMAISMFPLIIVGFYSYLLYIMDVAAIMIVYTGGAVAHFNLYTLKKNPGRKFIRFYARGMIAAIPALIISTTSLLFYLHMITGIGEVAAILFIISNIFFALSMLFPFIRQKRIVNGKERTLRRVAGGPPDPLQMRIRAVKSREPLLYVKNLGGREIANASQVGITSPVIIMTDYLFENMRESELSAILGHELGHYVNRDAYKSMVIFNIPIFLAIDSFLYAIMDISTITLALLAIFNVYLVLDLIFIFPWLRKRSEISADRFVGMKLGMAEDMVRALESLIIMNHRTPEYRFFSSRTHPSIEQRIRILRKNFN